MYLAGLSCVPETNPHQGRGFERAGFFIKELFLIVRFWFLSITPNFAVKLTGVLGLPLPWMFVYVRFCAKPKDGNPTTKNAQIIDLLFTVAPSLVQSTPMRLSVAAHVPPLHSAAEHEALQCCVRRKCSTIWLLRPYPARNTHRLCRA